MNIKSMIEENRNERKILTTSRNFKTGLLKYATIATLAAGVGSLVLGMPLVGISVIGGGIGLIVAKENLYDKYNYKIGRLNTEEAHLCKIYNGVDISPRAKANRKQQLQIINKKQQNAESAYIVSSATSAFLNLALTAATIAGIAIPGPLSFVSPLLSVAKIYKDKDKYDKKKVCETITACKNNLEVEQILAHEQEQNKAKQVQRTAQQQNIKRERTRTVQQPTPRVAYRPAYSTPYEPLYQETESKGSYQKVRR